MTTKRPEYQLCMPWYARDRLPRDSPDVRRPVVQRYGVPNWVPELLADPTSSVDFGVDDTWNYYVPGGGGTKQPVRTTQRTLFQPVQSLWYAVLIELCLAGADFTPAGLARDVAVRFVVRRERMVMPLPGPRPLPGQPPDPYRELARGILLSSNPGQEALVDMVADADLQDLLSAPAFIPDEFADEYQQLVHDEGVGREAQALTGGPDGPWTWTSIDVSEDVVAPMQDEREYPMWRVLPKADAKGPAKDRSLWFGAVPTDGPFLPPAPSDFRKADHRWTYTIICVAHQAAPSNMPQCPPQMFLTASALEWRLAPGDMKLGPEILVM